MFTSDFDGAEFISALEEANTDRETVNGHLMWTYVMMKFIGVSPEPRRIVGVVGR